MSVTSEIYLFEFNSCIVPSLIANLNFLNKILCSVSYVYLKKKFQVNKGESIARIKLHNKISVL